MNKINKFIKCSVVVSALLVSSAFATVVNESVNIKVDRPATPQNEMKISNNAAKVMLSVANARGDIAQKNAKRAKESLQKALTNINTIDKLRPTNKVTNHIEIAKKHLEYESSQEVGQDLIPIAYDIDELVNLRAVKVAKSHLEKAKEYLGLDKKAKAKKELEATEAAVQITGLYLPVNETKQYIYNALKSLNMGNFKKANDTLKKAEKNLVVMSVIGAGPLNNAKNSFYKAIVDYSHGEYNKAKADVQKSKQWLEKASHSSSKTVRDEANKLKEKTDTLKEEVSKKNDGVKAKLVALWHESKALSQRESDALGADYSSLAAKTKTRKALFNAKLHLEYARIKMFVSGTNSEVKQELNKTFQDLQEASKTADAKTKSSITSLEKEVNGLKKHISQKSSLMKEKYFKTKVDMQQTIRNI